MLLKMLQQLFGTAPIANFKELNAKGAQIIDVRTPGEFNSGHIKGAVNIPLDSLSHQLSKLKKDSVVITCCASGMRSASAKQILLSHGFPEVHNGGGWTGLQQKINQK